MVALDARNVSKVWEVCRTIRFVVVALTVFGLVGCATSNRFENQRVAREQHIETILSEPLDAAEYGQTKRCLAAHEYRDFRVLDDQRIVFEGRRGRLWLNTLRTRCPDLRYANVLAIQSISAMGRICDMDSFRAGDWFDWPWYRRWPWRWGPAWGTKVICSLGTFRAGQRSAAGCNRSAKMVAVG